MIQPITCSIRVHVGGGNIQVGADDLLDTLDEGGGDPVEFRRTQLRRIAVDAALAAAERHVHHRGLPGHQVGQRRRVLLVHVRVVTQSALVRAAGVVVLHPVTEVVQQVAVITLGDQLHLHHPSRGEQDLAHRRRQVQCIGCFLEVVVAFLEHHASAFCQFEGFIIPDPLAVRAWHGQRPRVSRVRPKDGGPSAADGISRRLFLPAVLPR